MALQINWIAVLVTALLGLLVQALWYAPKVFGGVWKELEGMRGEQKQDMGALALAAFCSLLMAFALEGFMNYFGSQTFAQGLLAGAQIWMGFVATTFLVDYRFAKRPWKLTMINLGHSLLSLGLMGGVLAVWK